MNVWMIFVQGDDATWLEGAWDDESMAENHSGWEAEVARVRKLCFEQRYEMRIINANVPGVFDAFESPTVQATSKVVEAS